MKQIQKNWFRTFTFILAVPMLFTVMMGCKKNGVGGNSTISGYIVYQNGPLPVFQPPDPDPNYPKASNALVSISYNALAPAAANQTIQADADGYYKFTNLLKGDYYISVIF